MAPESDLNLGQEGSESTPLEISQGMVETYIALTEKDSWRDKAIIDFADIQIASAELTKPGGVAKYDEVKGTLRDLTPETYIGHAERLTDMALEEITASRGAK